MRLAMRLIEDALDRKLEVPATPRRIVSLVPSVTELLFDLGAGERVVGVSRYCTEPGAALVGVARIGGQKDPDLDAVYALRPDLVIAVKEENLARDIEALGRRGIPVYVAEVRTVEEAVALIGEIGDLVDGEAARIEALGEAVRAGVGEARRRAQRLPGRVRVFCPVWRDPWISITSDTYMFDVLETCGAIAVPVSRSRERRYPKVTLDDVRAADPRVILLPDEPYAFTAADAAELLAALAERASGPPPVIHLVDGKLLSWYGKRTGDMAAIVSLLEDGGRTTDPAATRGGSSAKV